MADVDLEILAASLRADAGDTGTFVEGLAAKLEAMLPGQARVQRWREGLFGRKLVRKIAVDAGAIRLVLVRDQGNRIEVTRARVSGGIVLKSETVGIDEWLAALGDAIAAEARRSEQTRQALERVLMN